MPTVPTTEFTTRAERLGGVAFVTLYELMVSAPVSKTWYLSERAIAEKALGGTFDPDVFDPETFAVWNRPYQGIVLDASGAAAESSLGGSGQGGITVTLLDTLGTYGSGAGGGPGKRFSDWFAAPVPGYAEPYDLDSATLVVKVAFEGGGGSTDVLPVGRYKIVPGSKTKEDDRLTLTFEEDRTLHRPLPRRKITRTEWPNAAASVRGRPIPLIFGASQIVPGLPVDQAAGKYEFGESPAATPLESLVSVQILDENPDTDRLVLRKIVSPTNPVISFLSGTVAWVTLQERAQSFRLPDNMLLSALRFRLRPKSGDPAAAGRVTLRLVFDATALPSDDMAHRNATAELDAVTVTADALYTWTFLNPPLILGARTVWAILRYSPNSGAGAIEIRLDNDGGYADGEHAERGATREEWIKASGLVQEFATHDGHLRNGVAGEYFEGQGIKFQPVGPDSGGPWWGFFKFTISDNTATGLVKAEVLLRYVRNEIALGGPGPNEGLTLEEIADYGTLGSGDENIAARASFSNVFVPSNPLGTTATVNVTTRFQTAKTDGLSVFAFRMRTPTMNSNDGRWYGITALEQNDGDGARLKLTYSQGTDLHFEVDAATFTTSLATDDGSGNNVALVTFNRDLGENTVVAAEIHGIKDDGTGTYTGVANQRITNGADIGRWLTRAPIALKLATDRVDGPAFDTARSRLADWFALGGVMDEQLDSTQWLARLGRCCKSVFFEDQDGKLTIFTDGRAASVLRTVRPWEIGRLRQGALGEVGGGAETLPWTVVEVYFDHDRMAVENPETSRSPVAEWNDYAVISADQTYPADATRQAAAVNLEGRHGVRRNGGPTEGISEENAFWFVPIDTTTVKAGRDLRDWLWDQGSRRPDPFDAVEVSLPRFALGWRLMDEVRLESDEFGWEGARAQLGALRFKAKTFHGGTRRLYRARRGLFSVRAIRSSTAAGSEWPVLVTLKLIGWEF